MSALSLSCSASTESRSEHPAQRRLRELTRRGEISDGKLFFSMAVVAAVLLIQPLYAEAQHASPPTGRSEKESKMQEKRAFEKDTDEAYKPQLVKFRTPNKKSIPGAVCERPLKNSRPYITNVCSRG
jgi:hypothetical protein